MELFGVGLYQAARSGYASQAGEVAAPADEKKAADAARDSGAARDTVALSGAARDTVALSGAVKALEEASQTQGAEEANEEASGGQSGVNGCVGINAAKLARMLAAAKTRGQVQAVIAKIQADLDECAAGKEQGMDVDEASVKAAESLLQEAKSRLSGAENREATPEEEMASALASLM